MYCCVFYNKMDIFTALLPIESSYNYMRLLVIDKNGNILLFNKYFIKITI